MENSNCVIALRIFQLQDLKGVTYPSSNACRRAGCWSNCDSSALARSISARWSASRSASRDAKPVRCPPGGVVVLAAPVRLAFLAAGAFAPCWLPAAEQSSSAERMPSSAFCWRSVLAVAIVS